MLGNFIAVQEKLTEILNLSLQGIAPPETIK